MTTPVTNRQLVRCMWYHELCGNQKRSRPSECTKIVGGWGFAPDATGGAYSAPPAPLDGFKGPTSKGRGGEGGREGRAEDGLPRLEITSGYAFVSDYIILTACNVVLRVLFILIFYASHCMSCTCPYVHVFISFSGVIKA